MHVAFWADTCTATIAHFLVARDNISYNIIESFAAAAVALAWSMAAAGSWSALDSVSSFHYSLALLYCHTVINIDALILLVFGRNAIYATCRRQAHL